MSPYLLFFSLALGQIGRLSFLNQLININLFDIVVVLSLAIWFVRYRIRPLNINNKIRNSIFLFSLWIFFSFLISTNKFSMQENQIALLYLIRLLTYLVFFLYSVYALSEDSDLRTSFKKAIFFFIIATGLFSVLQYVLYPNLRNLSYLGWDPHQFRIFGTFLDTSAAAAIFGLILIYLFFTKLKISKTLFITTIYGYLLLGLLTYSRTFFISLFVTAAFFMFTRNKLKFLLPFFIIFLITIIFLPRQFGEGTNLLRIFSVQSRLQDQKKATELFMKNPIFGFGYNRIRALKDEPKMTDQISHANASFHSSFLIVLVTSGFIGLGLFVWLLFNFSTISITSQYYIIFLSIFSLFDNILLYPVVTVLILSLLALEYSKRGFTSRT